ncbi:MAG TPA: hypothetical protein VN714_03020 [Trebonia sp.]|nr:hypothetical protein [Trebonia sp.]
MSNGTSQFLETCSEVKGACQPCLIEPAVQHADLTAEPGDARFGWRRVGADARLGQVGGLAVVPGAGRAGDLHAGLVMGA